MLTFKYFVSLLLISCIRSEDKFETISSSYNQFAFQLYDKLAKNKDENVFYSPYSISSAMSMCLLGARENTEKQLKTVLDYNDLTADSINRGNAELFNYLNKFKEANLTLNIANKVYPKSGYPIKNEFLEDLKNIFKSYIHVVDFSKPKLAVSLINTWVSSQTNNKVNDLLSEDAIDETTALILINAIYFKGNWFYRFDKSETKSDKFHLEDGSTKDVDMMHLTDGFFKFKANPAGLKAQVCEFPYVGRSISMTIILPNDGVKLSEIESSLDYEKIKSINEIQVFRTRVDAYVPKFKFEQKTELVDVLSAMGASDAFDASKANFSGVTDIKGLYITKVIHKAVIEVSEEGTEAAAATAVVSNNRNSVIDIPLEAPPVFKCNKPFIFFIHENQNNTILFIGKYVK